MRKKLMTIIAALALAAGISGCASLPDGTREQIIKGLIKGAELAEKEGRLGPKNAEDIRKFLEKQLETCE